MLRISLNSLKLGYRKRIPVRLGQRQERSMLCQKKLKRNWHNCILRVFSCLKKLTGWIMLSGKFMGILFRLKITLNSVKSESMKSPRNRPPHVRLSLSTRSVLKSKADSLSWLKKTTDLPNLSSKSNQNPPGFKPKFSKRSSSRSHQNSKPDLGCWPRKTKDSNFNFHQPPNPQTLPLNTPNSL